MISIVVWSLTEAHSLSLLPHKWAIKVGLLVKMSIFMQVLWLKLVKPQLIVQWHSTDPQQHLPHTQQQQWHRDSNLQSFWMKEQGFTWGLEKSVDKQPAMWQLLPQCYKDYRGRVLSEVQHQWWKKCARSITFKPLPKEFTSFWLRWSPPDKPLRVLLYNRVFKPVFLHWLTSNNAFWQSFWHFGINCGSRVGFSMDYRLQQLQECWSIWHHKCVNSVCVVTFTARRGRQKLLTAGLSKSTNIAI